MKTIPLTQGQFALVDDEDYQELSQWNWFALKAKRTYYACRQVRLRPGKQTMLGMHQHIMQTTPGVEVDHKNHIGTDNQRHNLRVCSKSLNTQHYQKPSTNTSGFIGVSRLGTKWRAEFAVNGKNIYLGLFTDPAEAARIRDQEVKKHRGEFAVLNFP